jgi:RimJ/RimL family protein N-acetyltransferase
MRRRGSGSDRTPTCAPAPSIRLAERVGFRREGLLREDYAYDGRFYDTVVYGKLASDL